MAANCVCSPGKNTPQIILRRIAQVRDFGFLLLMLFITFQTSAASLTGQVNPGSDNARQPPSRKRRFDIMCELSGPDSDPAKECERIPFDPLATVGELGQEISKRFQWSNFELLARKGRDGIPCRLDEQDVLQDVVAEDERAFSY